MRSQEKLLLVIPAYNECVRLPLFLNELIPALASAPWSTLVRIVDDGSSLSDSVKMKAFLSENNPIQCKGHVEIQFKRLPVNRGKGAAIRSGWENAGDASVLGFIDADGSIGPAEVIRTFSWLLSEKLRSTVFTSRVKMLGRVVDRKAFRHYIGRVFATFSSSALNVEVYDSQCGFKLIPRHAYELVRDDLSESGYCFDLELLMELARRGLEVVEFPVNWRDIGGSKVRVFRDGWQMYRGVMRLRRRRAVVTHSGEAVRGFGSV